MEHKPNSIFEAAASVLFDEAVQPPPRVSREITYVNEHGNTRVSSVSQASEAQEIKTIKALGGKIVKIVSVTH
jgi:hypothetical protein